MTDINEIVKTLASSAGARHISDPAKQAEYAAAKIAMNEEAKANWGNQSWQAEIAAVLAARLDYMAGFTNPLQGYLRTHSVAEGDFVEIKERRGMKAFWTARGGYVDESQIFTKRYTVPRDRIGFHVAEHDDKARVNFGETMENVISMGYNRMESTIAGAVFGTFESVYDVASDYYIPVSGTLTKDALDSAISEVWDAPRPDNWGPKEVTILGRRSAIDAVLNVATGTANLFAPNMTDEIQRSGKLGVYRGANIVVIPNYVDEDGQTSLIANDSLWIFSQDIGDFVNYGGTKTRMWDNPTTDRVHFKAVKEIGWALSRPDFGRRIQLLDESS